MQDGPERLLPAGSRPPPPSAQRRRRPHPDAETAAISDPGLIGVGRAVDVVLQILHDRAEREHPSGRDNGGERGRVLERCGWDLTADLAQRNRIRHGGLEAPVDASLEPGHEIQVRAGARHRPAHVISRAANAGNLVAALPAARGQGR